MARKRENNKFLVSPGNRVPRVTGPRNGAETPIQCGIAHETDIKYENIDFLVSPLNGVPRVTEPRNDVGTPKQCEIAQEKAREREKTTF
jgi:hypothetical protein